MVGVRRGMDGVGRGTIDVRFMDASSVGGKTSMLVLSSRCVIVT